MKVTVGVWQVCGRGGGSCAAFFKNEIVSLESNQKIKWKAIAV